MSRQPQSSNFLLNACGEAGKSYENTMSAQNQAMLEAFESLKDSTDTTMQQLHDKVYLRAMELTGNKQPIAWTAIGSASRHAKAGETLRGIKAFLYIGLSYEQAPLPAIGASAEKVIRAFLARLDPACRLTVIMNNPPRLTDKPFTAYLELTAENVKASLETHLRLVGDVCVIVEGHGILVPTPGDASEPTGKTAFLKIGDSGGLLPDDIWEKGLAERTANPELGQGLFINDFCHCGGTFNPKAVQGEPFRRPAKPWLRPLIGRGVPAAGQPDLLSILTLLSSRFIPTALAPALRYVSAPWFVLVLVALLVLPLLLASLSIIASGPLVTVLSIGAPTLLAMLVKHLYATRPA